MLTQGALSGVNSNTRATPNMRQLSFTFRLLQRRATFRASAPEGNANRINLRCYKISM
jgi:hypothetical protein